MAATLLYEVSCWTELSQRNVGTDKLVNPCNVDNEPEWDTSKWLSIYQYVEVVEPASGDAQIQIKGM
jgi:hypothetical protein